MTTRRRCKKCGATGIIKPKRTGLSLNLGFGIRWIKKPIDCRCNRTKYDKN